VFLGFGEVMMRVCPEQRLRWQQALPGRVEVTWGGGEANVCASLAMYNRPVRFLTALPDHPVSRSLEQSLRGLGVDTSHIYWRERGRLGVYYVEVGANQRGSTILYDRDNTAISQAAAAEYDFDAALEGIRWVHLTGITPAISEAACAANLELARRAKQAGASVCCDLNYRNKLWRWHSEISGRELARQQMAELLPLVDLVIGNEEDAADVLDIHPEKTDVTRGQLDVDSYQQVARSIAERYPNVSSVAITLRESISADHNNWGGMLLDVASDKCFLAPISSEEQYAPYQVHDIVDRIGAGDSFAAGLLHALHSEDFAEPARAIQFAVAASCLKHSVKGDFNFVSHQEVAALVVGDASGRVQR
jgi:2-dehydro-3-deoxygluconokinase